MPRCDEAEPRGLSVAPAFTWGTNTAVTVAAAPLSDTTAAARWLHAREGVRPPSWCAQSRTVSRGTCEEDLVVARPCVSSNETEPFVSSSSSCRSSGGGGGPSTPYPKLRFLAAPKCLVPFRPFALVLDVTDALGGTLSALHLLEALRSRQHLQQAPSPLLKGLYVDHSLPPVNVRLSMERCDYGLHSSEGADDNSSTMKRGNNSRNRETTAAVVTCPSPFANMRYGNDGDGAISHAPAPPFTTMSGILSDQHLDGLAISRIGSSDRSANNNISACGSDDDNNDDEGEFASNAVDRSAWAAFAHSEPCVAVRPPESSRCGVRFRVGSHTRAIIGLLNARHGRRSLRSRLSHDRNSGGENNSEDGASDEEEGEGQARDETMQCVAKETVWLFLRYSIHLSADCDTKEGPLVFRIYEHGQMAREVGDQIANIGDVFAIRLLPSGRCVYLHNDQVCYISPHLSRPQCVYSVMLRVAYQATVPALDGVTLLPFVSGLPRVDVPSSLVCKPLWPPALAANLHHASPAAVEVADGESAMEGVILRAWLEGFPVDAALHSTTLARASFPMWAIAALSLVSSFALASGGRRSDGVTEMLREHHRHAPLLLVQQWQASEEEYPRRPRTYGGRAV
ncbi:hypothetical protein DQ04_03471050 [Trypanosoma grayi]|uniref:hypothetical protein n=1 Tax=Trypanosoma grayi TaxID=71804 RepID=UPI0004F401C4|nr:hypothetical protein DQ04_03471050 [Trypanosoma grayi]KEG10645.1 hypothetical protein DQ04_03471050 [Trypanosoma grayi]